MQKAVKAPVTVKEDDIIIPYTKLQGVSKEILYLFSLLRERDLSEGREGFVNR